MTRIKYATVCYMPSDEKVMVVRGKKTGTVGRQIAATDDNDLFGGTLHAERVVTLPDTMTPTEFREFMTSFDGSGDGERSLATAIDEVAAEKDIEHDPLTAGDTDTEANDG